LPVYPQSTLEYAGLITRQAAASANKDKDSQSKGPSVSADPASDLASQALKKTYSDSAALLSKTSSMLGNVGGPSLKKEEKSEPKVKPEKVEIKEALEEVQEIKEGQTADIHLKNGKTVTGKLVKQNENSIELECEGVALTYFNDEIEKIVI